MEGGSNSWKLDMVQAINQGSTSYLIGDLTANKEYSVKMAARNAHGMGEYDTYHEAVPTLAFDPVFIPEASIKGITRNSISVGWTDPPEKIAPHIHFYKVSKYSGEQVSEVLHTQPYPLHLFGDLSSATSYKFTVAACNQYSGECSPPSEVIPGTTYDGLAGAPSDVEIHCKSDNVSMVHWVDVKWGPPEETSNFHKGPHHLLLGLHVLDQVNHSVGVAHLVVIPADKLNKSLRELNASLGVKDGGVGISNEIGRYNLFVGIAQVPLHSPLSGILYCVANFIISGFVLEDHSEVNNGHVGSRNPEGHAGQFSIEFRNDFSHSLGGSGGGGDDVLGGAAAVTPVLPAGTVQGLLCCRHSVHGGHQTFDNSIFVVDDLGEGSKAVGGAGGVGHDVHV